MNKLFLYIFFVALLLGGVYLFLNYRYRKDVVLVTPIEDSYITSPLYISGTARGWYFEGSFPVLLLDSENRVIAQKAANAQSNWMTDSPVDFVADITFPKQTSGSRGYLILKKDNPSGDPSRDAELNIPIFFK